jgi:hypothetical protein
MMCEKFTFLHCIVLESIDSAEMLSRVKLCVTVIEQYTDVLLSLSILNRRGLGPGLACLGMGARDDTRETG